MARMKWDNAGERLYETGVDRGVLYLDGIPGIPWSGITSVQEAPNGGDPQPFYLDGVKYLNRSASEEFEATIEAFTYPEEFGRCDGSLSVGNGLFTTQQRRRSFGFSYRTLVGNDLEGSGFAYKIHIIYDALAQPASRAYGTIANSSTPLNFSWKLSTKPSMLDGFRPAAHFVIDSREVPDGLLGYIEDVLYGTEQQTPRLPSAGELAFLFTSFNNTVFDAGDVLEVSYLAYDAGTPSAVNTEVFDGGTAEGNTEDDVPTFYDAGPPDSDAPILDGGAP